MKTSIKSKFEENDSYISELKQLLQTEKESRKSERAKYASELELLSNKLKSWDHDSESLRSLKRENERLVNEMRASSKEKEAYFSRDLEKLR